MEKRIFSTNLTFTTSIPPLWTSLLAIYTPSMDIPIHTLQIFLLPTHICLCCVTKDQNYILLINQIRTTTRGITLSTYLSFPNIVTPSNGSPYTFCRTNIPLQSILGQQVDDTTIIDLKWKKG